MADISTPRLTPDQQEHNRHIETRRYEYGRCSVCLSLLLNARANHREHAFSDMPHTNNECVTAYIEHGRHMRAS